MISCRRACNVFPTKLNLVKQKSARSSHCALKKFLGFIFSDIAECKTFAGNLVTKTFIKRFPEQIIIIIKPNKMATNMMLIK